MITLALPYPISANRYLQTRVIRKGAASMAMAYVSAAAEALKAGWVVVAQVLKSFRENF